MKLEDLKCVDNNINLDKHIEYREYVKSNGYRTAIETIYPDNIYSINNLIKVLF